MVLICLPVVLNKVSSIAVHKIPRPVSCKAETSKHSSFVPLASEIDSLQSQIKYRTMNGKVEKNLLGWYNN